MVVAAACDVGSAAGPSRRKITAGGLPGGAATLLVIAALATHAAVCTAQQQRYRPEQSVQGGVTRRHDVVAVDTHRASVNVGSGHQAAPNNNYNQREATNHQGAGPRTDAMNNHQGAGHRTDSMNINQGSGHRGQDMVNHGGHRAQDIVNHGGHRAQDSSHDPYHQSNPGHAATGQTSIHRPEMPRRPVSNRGTAAPSPVDHRAATQQGGGGGHRTGGGGGGAIVFPDRQFKPRIGATGPGCARGNTFCEDVSDYPENYVSSVLANSLQFQEFFGSDVPPPQLSDRISPERTLCDSQEKLIFPKMAQNANNEWMYVVNLDGEYKQGIRVEICRSEGNACLMADRFPEGSHATCRQKYIYRKLVALSESGDPVPDSFRLPSCCACFVEENVLAGRFGGRANNATNATNATNAAARGRS